VNANRSITLERLAREHLPPDLPVEVDPSARRPFGAYNVVASFPSAEEARAALRGAESAGADPQGLSLLLVGGRRARAPEGGNAVGPDPEGVAGYTVRRVVPGAIIGAIVGAIIVALAAGLLGSFEPAELIGGGIGGALLGAAVGGMVGAFSGFDDSDAWRSTFTDLRDELALAAVRAESRSDADAMRQQFTSAGARRTWLVDGNGRAIGGRRRS